MNFVIKYKNTYKFKLITKISIFGDANYDENMRLCYKTC